ncbi:MAG: sigma-70 family RNA polymerase sigma factor [Ruminococcaceae bacterium]|nr:sigma-70 family RNA polymerase sigma factor [Oscillospiraceae bacterium]
MSSVLQRENTHDEDMRLYLHQIRQYPLLTAQEEKELALASAAGDQDAIRKLVSSNLRLVVSIARDYAGRGVPLLDLIQEGSIGLLVAARKFDPSLDYRFSTYATKWIHQGVSRCILNHGGLIRVPVRTAERMRKLSHIQNDLRQTLHREPTVEELAEACQMDADKVQKTLDLIPQVCSLDTPAGEDDTLQALLEDIHAPEPQEALVRQELKDTMDALLDRLTPRQKEVMRLRFGMEDGVCYSQEAIGTRLGISKERARQIEQEAVKKLRKLSADLDLEEFLD